MKFFYAISAIVLLVACGSPENSDNPPVTSPFSSKLLAPSVNIAVERDRINLNWNDSNADQYRVLIWRGEQAGVWGNDAPQEYMTNSITYTLPSLTSLTYTIIVEAYDELGNSLFSAPVTAVVR